MRASSAPQRIRTQAPPRPTGRSTRVIITEWDLPRADHRAAIVDMAQVDMAQVDMVRPESAHVDGKVWSQNNGFAAVHRLRSRDRRHRVHAAVQEPGGRREPQHPRHPSETRRTTSTSPTSPNSTSDASTPRPDRSRDVLGGLQPRRVDHQIGADGLGARAAQERSLRPNRFAWATDEIASLYYSWRAASSWRACRVACMPPVMVSSVWNFPARYFRGWRFDDRINAWQSDSA